jgi:hypothetical protein
MHVPVATSHVVSVVKPRATQSESVEHWLASEWSNSEQPVAHAAASARAKIARKPRDWVSRVMGR